jgi:hypothetical protein
LEIRADSGAVEVIANLTGCKGTIRIEAKELREGACHTETGDYLITTLPEERYKVTWLDSERDLRRHLSRRPALGDQPEGGWGVRRCRPLRS